MDKNIGIILHEGKSNNEFLRKLIKSPSKLISFKPAGKFLKFSGIIQRMPLNEWFNSISIFPGKLLSEFMNRKIIFIEIISFIFSV